MIKSRIRDVYHSTHEHRIGVVTWWYLLLSFMAVTVLVAGFVHLTDEVIEGSTLHLDQAVLLGIHQVHSPWLDALVASTTDIGGLIGVVILTLLAVGLLCLARKYRAVVQLLIGVGGAGLMNVLLKNMFERARPDLWQWLVHESSYSFPSGHAMASSALAMSVVLILWHTRWRWGAVAAAALYTVYVGLTRLYLGVHYPSDISAAWIISAAWVVLASMVIGTIKPRIMKRR